MDSTEPDENIRFSGRILRLAPLVLIALLGSLPLLTRLVGFLNIFECQEVSKRKNYAEKTTQENGIRTLRDNTHLIGIKRA